MDTEKAKLPEGEAHLGFKRGIRFDQFCTVAKAAGWTVLRLVKMLPGITVGVLGLNRLRAFSGAYSIKTQTATM